MGIKWDRLMENERRQFEKMREADRFIYFLLLQFGSPYGWGKENPAESDCSGAVCMALYAATGLLIRITADGLFKQVFTKVNPRQGDIRAVFYVTKKNQKHGDRTVDAGTAIHVAGFVDDAVVLNSQEPYARVRRINDVSDWYLQNGFAIHVRGLDRDALANLSGKEINELDAEFGKYFTNEE